MRVFRHAAVLTITILLYICSSPLGRAHDAASGWSYPWECCSSTDCWETSSATEKDPLATAAGWQLQDGSIVPFNLTRPSPDGAFHVCRRGGQLNGPLITPSGGPACLWVPSSS